MKKVTSPAVLLLALLVGPLYLTGCGWSPIFESRAPDGRAEVRILKRPPITTGSYLVHIELNDGHRREIIYRHDVDSFITLVEVLWNSDRRTLSILACNSNSDTIIMGYDLQNRVILPSGTYEDALKEQIRIKYSLSAQVNPISWACSDEGTRAYQRLTIRGSNR